jgi:N-acetylneuraminate synthase
MELPEHIFDDYLVININDSELIYPGMFAVFHRQWVFENLKKNGFKSQYYISDIAYEDFEDQITVPYYPYAEGSIETLMEKLHSEELFITDFLFISAIKLALMIANLSSREEVSVYFLGFDFDLTDSSGKSLRTDQDDLEYRNAFLRTQESIFKYTVQFFNEKETNIELKHIGEKIYSSISLDDFIHSNKVDKIKTQKKPDNYNSLLYEELKQQALEGKTLIVAELTNNHVGDPTRLKKMIRLAKEAGADLIKVQKRDVDNFYTENELESPYKSPFGNTLGDYRRGVEMEDNLFNILIKECSEQEIAWFSTVLDYASYQYVQKFDCPLIKIPSTISNHRNFIQKISENHFDDIVVSTGYTDQKYEDFILDNFYKEDRFLWMLQCSSSYPTPPEAAQIAVVRHYDHLHEKKYSKLMPGYSSHDVGSQGCMLAVASGARMVEKHVKLGNLEWVHFDGVAVDLYHDEFKKFASDVRKSELMCGDCVKKIHPQEHHKYTPNVIHN